MFRLQNFLFWYLIVAVTLVVIAIVRLSQITDRSPTSRPRMAAMVSGSVMWGVLGWGGGLSVLT